MEQLIEPVLKKTSSPATGFAPVLQFEAVFQLVVPLFFQVTLPARAWFVANDISASTPTASSDLSGRRKPVRQDT
jgi:hypothetical protein